MASALFLGSWAVMMGPLIYGKPLTSLLLLSHLCSRPPVRVHQSQSASSEHSSIETCYPSREAAAESTRVFPSVGTMLILRNSAPSDLPRTSALHSHLLRQHCADAVLRGRGKSNAPVHHHKSTSSDCRFLPCSSLARKSTEPPPHHLHHHHHTTHNIFV